MYGYEKTAICTTFKGIEKYIFFEFVEVDFLAQQETPYYENDKFGLVTSERLGSGLGFHHVPRDEGLLEPDTGIAKLSGLFIFDTPFFSAEALQKGGAGFAAICTRFYWGIAKHISTTMMTPRQSSQA